MYHNIKEELFTNVLPENQFGKFIQFPITRIFVVIICLIPVTILGQLIGLEWIKSLDEPYSTLLRSFRTIFFFLLFLLAYRTYTNYVERRKALEFSTKNLFSEFAMGFFISLCVVGFIVGLMMILGYYQIESFNTPKILYDRIFIYGMGSFVEELLFRLIVFKLVEEYAGSWIGIIVQGILFGLAHIGNENATLWTSAALIISDTILFGAAFMLTRRIWLIWGLHFSWNYFQEGVFGMPNSGYQRDGLIKPIIDGPEWITGGKWGIEASFIPILILIVIGLILLKKAIEMNQLVLPVWKRR